MRSLTAQVVFATADLLPKSCRCNNNNGKRFCLYKISFCFVLWSHQWISDHKSKFVATKLEMYTLSSQTRTLSRQHVTTASVVVTVLRRLHDDLTLCMLSLTRPVPVAMAARWWRLRVQNVFRYPGLVSNSNCPLVPDRTRRSISSEV